MTVKTYSPKNIILVVGGRQLTGIQNIEITFDTKRFTKVKGIRGYNTRVRSKDFGGNIKLEVLQTSDTNEVLFNIMANDAVNMNGRLDVTIKDLGSKTLMSTNEAYIDSETTLSWSMGFDSRTWNIPFSSVQTLNITGATSSTADGIEKILNKIYEVI